MFVPSQGSSARPSQTVDYPHGDMKKVNEQVLALLHAFNETDHYTSLECAEGAMDILRVLCPNCAVHIFAMTNYTRFDIPNSLFLTMRKPDEKLTKQQYDAVQQSLRDLAIIRFGTGEAFIPVICGKDPYGAIALVPDTVIQLRDSELQLIGHALAQKWAYRMEFGRVRIMNEVSSELTAAMEAVYTSVMQFVCAPPRTTSDAEVFHGSEMLVQKKIYEMAQELVPCDRVALWMVEGDELVIHDNGFDIRSHAMKEFAGRVVIAGIPLSSDEPQDSSKLGPWSTTLCVPVILNETVTAVLQFVDKMDSSGGKHPNCYNECTGIIRRLSSEYHNHSPTESSRTLSKGTSFKTSRSAGQRSVVSGEISSDARSSKKTVSIEAGHYNTRQMDDMSPKSPHVGDANVLKACKTGKRSSVGEIPTRTIAGHAAEEKLKWRIRRNRGSKTKTFGRSVTCDYDHDQTPYTDGEEEEVASPLSISDGTHGKKRRSPKQNPMASSTTSLGFTACDIEVATILLSGPVFLALRAASMAGKLAREKRNAIEASNFNVALSTMQTAEDLTRSICKQIARILRAERCLFFFVNEASKEIWSPPTEFTPHFFSMKFTDASKKSIIGRVALSRTAHMSTNPEDCSGLGQPDDLTCRQILAAPVICVLTKKVIAVIQIINKIPQTAIVRMIIHEKNPSFSKFDGELLQVLCKETGLHLNRLSYDILEMRALRDEVQNHDVAGSMQSFVQMHFGQHRPLSASTTLRRLKHADQMSSGFVSRSFQDDDPMNVFDGIDYFELSNNEDIVLVEKVLQAADLTLHLHGPELPRFIQKIREGYFIWPYHNWIHGLQCFHQCFLVANDLRLFEWDNGFSLPLRLGILLGGIAHDVGHSGRGNNFEIASQSSLALRYNDRSVLENHHCATLYEILLHIPILQKLDKETQVQLREVIIDAILQTDMVHHSEHVKELFKTENTDEDGPPTRTTVNWIMHACDIGAGNLSAAVASKFSISIMMEFTQQVADERKLGIPVTGFMDGLDDPKRAAFSQIGFLDYVVLPMWSQMAVRYPALNIENLRTFKTLWEEVSNDDSDKAQERMNKLALPWTEKGYLHFLINPGRLSKRPTGKKNPDA